MPWLEVEQQNAEKAYCQITKRFTELANDFLVSARNLGSADMAYLPQGWNRSKTFASALNFAFTNISNWSVLRPQCAMRPI